MTGQWIQEMGGWGKESDFIPKAGWLTEKMANYRLVGVWMPGSFMDHSWGMVGAQSKEAI